MRALHTLLLLCVLGAALLSSGLCSGSLGPDDCCFQLYPRRIHKRHIAAYYVTDFRCPRMAVILVTQKKKNVCADPNQSWVQNIMRTVDDSSF